MIEPIQCRIFIGLFVPVLPLKIPLPRVVVEISLNWFNSDTYFNLFQTMTLFSIGMSRGLSHVFSDLGLGVVRLVDIGKSVRNEQVYI